MWTFSKHHTFKYDFWEKTQYSNMNFWDFLFTPALLASASGDLQIMDIGSQFNADSNKPKGEFGFF